MSELPTAMAANLAGNRVLLFGAVKIELRSGYTIRLLDGSGALMIGGELYQGRDPIYGVLDTVEGIEDTIGDSVPTLDLGLIPAGDVALASLIDSGEQGSEVTAMVGTVDLSTGQPVATPYTVFTGFLDVPTITWGENDRRLGYTVASDADRLFRVEEGRRLSSAFHQLVWPGETGLDYCTDVEVTIAWGQAVDNTVVYTRTNLPGYADTYNRT
jgi:hypothetical protein